MVHAGVVDARAAEMDAAEMVEIARQVADVIVGPVDAEAAPRGGLRRGGAAGARAGKADGGHVPARRQDLRRGRAQRVADDEGDLVTLVEQPVPQLPGGAFRFRDAGRVHSASGDGRIPFIDTRDIAAVAAEVLTSDGHEGRTYALTGPEAVSYGEVTEILADVLDRDLEYVSESEDEAWRRLLHPDDRDRDRLLAEHAGRAKPDITRFKGLGEMMARTLWETTLDPKTRRLLRVEIDDRLETDQIMADLMGRDPAARFRFIMDRAEEAQAIDV